jgi:hypothetical protein
VKIQKTLWINIFCNDGEVTTKGPYDTEFAASAAIDMFGHIVSFPMTFEIEKPEPKPPKLMAPALCRRLGSKRLFVTEELYASKEEARERAMEWADLSFISWPAVPNKDGMYEVPSENIP